MHLAKERLKVTFLDLQAVVSDTNRTVFMSLSPSDCIAGQNATDMPSGGSLMEISPICKY